MKPLKLEVLFGSKDNLSPALKLMVGSSNAAAKALKATRDEIKKLNDQQKQIDGFIKQKKATEDSAKSLKDVQDRIKSLRQEMATNPSDKLTKDFEKATKEAKKLKDAHAQNQIKLQELRNELKQTGVSTGSLADHQVELSRKMTTANTSIDSQKKKLENLNRIQQSHSKMSSNVRTAALAGAGMTATGTAALFAMRKPIDESKNVDVEQNRIGALGLGKDATKEAIDYARALKTFGTSTLDNLTLVRDGVTAFADVHHAKMVAPMLAKMKFSNEAMFGQEHGAENEKKFMDMLKVIELRGGLKNDKEFKNQANIIQQVITATGGRVQSGEWLNAIKTGGVAVKGMSNEALYYKMEPIVQELGGHRFGTSAMSAYQNIYQGRTTVRAARNMADFGLLDANKVTYDKVGQVAHINPGGLKGGDLFKQDQFAWMEQILLPALAKKGITEKGAIHDAIGSMFTNRNASNLFTTMYDQREQIHKNAKLNAGAENIDQLSERAKGTTAGKELEAKAKLHDVYLQFGQTILPAYTKALEIATGALQNFTLWMQQNPTLAKALGTGLLVIAGGLVALGGLLVVFSPLILSMLSLRLMMATLGVQGGALSFVFKMLTSPFKALGSAVMWIGRMFMIVGRMMLGNPIILAITLLATAAYLIYQNWDPIKAFFIDLWSSISSGASQAWSWVSTQASQAWGWIQSVFSPVGQWFTARWVDIKTAFSGGIAGVSALIINWSPLGLFYSAFATVLSWFGIELPSKFTGFGSMIIDGLINGIKSGFTKLKSVWSEVTSYVPSFFTKKMEIHSPSRVMAALGGHVMGGIGLGLEQGFPNLKAKLSDAIGIFKPDSDLLQKINVAPALGKIKPASLASGSANAGSYAIQGDTITININAAPGQNIQQLQSMLENMLNKREREKMSRVRSSFKDQE